MFTGYTLRPGDVGIAVNKIQAYFNLFQERGIISVRLNPDGRYGSATELAVRQYQRYAKLNVTGIIDSNTWDSIINTLASFNITTDIPVYSPSYVLKIGDSGIAVFKMQEYINAIAANEPCLRPITVDGSYGEETRQAVRQFQYLNNLAIDGTIGRYTWDAIINQYMPLIRE